MIPVNLVSARASFFICTRGCGCIEHPAFPAPSSIEGAKELKEFLQTSGAWRREIAEVCLAPSLRANGSGERPPADRLREAIQFSPRKVWIASAYAKERFGGLQARHSSRERRRVVASAPSQ